MAEAHRPSERTDGARRQRERARRRRHPDSRHADRLSHLAAGRLERDANIGQHPRCATLVVGEKAEEQMLSPNSLVVKRTRLHLSRRNRATRVGPKVLKFARRFGHARAAMARAPATKAHIAWR